MAKKVAYVVFEGRKPGIYTTWADTKEQTNGYHGELQRGYTIADGGRDAAEKAYAEYTKSKQLGSEIGGGQAAESEKRDASFFQGKKIG